MAHPPDLGPPTPAMPNMLVRMSISTRGWLIIHSLLRNHAINEELAGTRAWLADHIWRELLIETGVLADDDRESTL